MASSSAPPAPPLSPPRRTPVPRGLATDGPAILSYGFRPFFLGAASFALIAMILWIGALTAGWPVGGRAYGALWWHAHEMLFGYAAAALAGFMLTAIPNWTGRLPLSGRPLLALVALWLVGRLAMLAPEMMGVYPAVALDAAFLPVLALVAGREIVVGQNWKNLKILVALLLLSGANLWLHFAVLTGGDPQMALRAGVGTLVMLIGLVGGRIIPSFTRNWLVKAAQARLPAAFGRLDVIATAATGVAFGAWVAIPESRATAGLAALAALLQAVRLARWRGPQTLEEPLLLVLHLAYGFVPVGLGAVALAALGWLSPPSALHLLTVGAIGNTTLAVMARATRGHTGRSLTASPISSLAFLSLLLSAVLRPFAELMPEAYHLLLSLSGATWIIGFALFLFEYGPMLLRPRVAAKQPRD